MRSLVLVLIIFFVACSSSPESPPTPTEEIQPTKNAEKGLNQAKLWLKLAELEEKFRQQQEKLTLLEQKVLLGFVPEGLQSPAEKSHKQMMASKQPEQRLGEQLFASGKYLLAENAFLEELQQTQDPQMQQEIHYWLARCKYAQKNYFAASQKLNQILKNISNNNPLWNKIQLSLAKTEWALGFKDKAKSRLSHLAQQGNLKAQELLKQMGPGS